MINENKPVDDYLYWEEYPDFPVEDWGNEVIQNHTRLGYWDWVKARIAEYGNMEN